MKKWLCRCGIAVILLWSSMGFASEKSYLNEAALLLEETRIEEDLVAKTLSKSTIAMALALCESRNKIAAQLEVPEKLSKAHPHLLLAISNALRAFEAASQGNSKKFAEQLMAARDEDRNYRTLLKELGVSLPDLKAIK